MRIFIYNRRVVGLGIDTSRKDDLISTFYFLGALLETILGTGRRIAFICKFKSIFALRKDKKRRISLSLQ
ncbi:hypothetical protein BZG02_07090 [Labilibaculum filiforme]|uniref:Uncharacterized protein n=1 Tax=Labilibaculum filiforme TaxID=1940526 RepID=A0A2N3I0D3_9BACT|nr:hypothetical protein BZG02_07090 [Labilibaculum filiforme]